jgi:PAS domain S-box-containing protein
MRVVHSPREAKEGAVEVSALQDSAMQCRRLEERLRVLSDATRAFAEATTDAQGLLDVVARRVAEVVKDYCVVLLLSDDGTTLVPASMFDPDPEALRRMKDVLSEPFLLETHPVARRVVESGEAFLAARLDLEALRPPRTTPRFYDFMRVVGMHSMLIVALRVHGRSLGQLTLARFRPGSPPFDEHDLVLAQSLADHAALAVTNARLLSEARRGESARARTEDRLRFLAESSHEFSAATSDLHHLLEVVARRLGELVGDLCVIRAVSDDGEWLESTGAAYHRDPALLEATREVMLSDRQRVGEGVSGRVAATGQLDFTPRIDTAAFVASSEPKYRAYLERHGVASSITLPLLCRGKVVGVANLMRSRPDHPYDEDELGFVQSVADHAALALGNARSYSAEHAARAMAEKATGELRQARARMARLRDAGIIGILVVGLDRRVVEINDALLTLLGYSRDEILSGRIDWKDVTAPEEREADQRSLEQLKRSGFTDLREKDYLRKDGTRVTVLVGSAMLEDEADRYIAFVLDLTQQKAAQAAIVRLREERAADARARHLAAIADSSDDAIIGKTLQGVITSWNGGAYRLFGYPADEIIGQSISLLIPPELEDEEPAILNTVAHGQVKRFDTVRRRKDGSLVHVAVTGAPVRDASGQVVGISKVARDITARKRAEADLARARDAAEAANRELEAFSYSVAHDLRAPLRGMNGFAQVLVDTYKDKLDAEGQDWLQEILLNAKKMGDLIDGLLSLARVTRSGLKRERTDLSRLVRETASAMHALDPGRRVQMSVKDSLVADVDPRLARALVQNLLGNAWKFTGNVATAAVEFGATEENGSLAFFVRDNGAGFDMAFAGKLFAPFQRLHSADEFAGTGIGLATVQRIVHRHGGRIWAEGAVGRGATFYFTLAAQGAGGMP